MDNHKVLFLWSKTIIKSLNMSFSAITCFQELARFFTQFLLNAQVKYLEVSLYGALDCYIVKSQLPSSQLKCQWVLAPYIFVWMSLTFFFSFRPRKKIWIKFLGNLWRWWYTLIWIKIKKYNLPTKVNLVISNKRVHILYKNIRT